MLKQPLSLVPLDRHHSEAYFHLSSHPDVWRGRRTAPLPTVEMTSHLIREWSATPQRTDYTIEDDSGLFCGALSLKENQSCQHLAYWVGRTFWGQGVATQAVRRLITTLSERHTGRRICVSIAKGNLPSIRVAGKNGFVQASSMIEPAREGPGDALSFTLSY